MSTSQRTYVVGVDATEEGGRALDWTRAAASVGDSIVAVHVWDLPMMVGIDTVAMSTADGAGQRAIEAHYASDEDRALIVNVDSAFGGRYFPEYEVDATLLVEDVPQTWDFYTDFTTTLDIEASSRVGRIAMEGSITEQREQPEPEEGEEPPDPVYDTTSLFAQLEGIPTSLDYLVDLSPEGQAFLHLSDAIDLISVELWAEASNGAISTILDTDYGHLRLIAEDVPASFDADWGSGGGLHGTLTTSEPLGPVELVVSKRSRNNTINTRARYSEPSAAVEYTPFTREIDRRYWRQGPGDENAREAIFMGRLDGLYDTSIALDDDEDHLLMLQDGAGEMNFLSVRGTGFQSLTAEVTDVATAELSIPFDGDHPFFLGMRDAAGETTLVQIDNIPDTTTVEVGSDHADIDFDSSPGDVVIFKGPLGTADVHADITKVIINDAPTSVHTDWDVGAEGTLAVDVSNPVAIQMLTQDSDGRTVVDLGVDDLTVSWSTSDWVTDPFVCSPVGCGVHTYLTRATLDIDADSPISGMIAHYDKTAGPMPLDGDSPVKDFVEMVPRVTALFDGFEGISGSTQAAICDFGACAPGIPVYWATLGVDVGSVTVDVWDRGHPHVGLLGDPDYVGNDPWHLYPLSHDAHDHVLPAHMFSPI